jgi:hypothetical protein
VRRHSSRTPCRCSSIPGLVRSGSDDSSEVQAAEAAAARAREAANAADLRAAALRDAVEDVEDDLVRLIESRQDGWRRELGDRRKGAERRVAEALEACRVALTELARQEALASYLADFPEVELRQGAYSTTTRELPLYGQDGAPLTVVSVLAALGQAAARPTRPPRRGPLATVRAMVRGT